MHHPIAPEALRTSPIHSLWSTFKGIKRIGSRTVKDLEEKLFCDNDQALRNHCIKYSISKPEDVWSILNAKTVFFKVMRCNHPHTLDKKKRFLVYVSKIMKPIAMSRGFSSQDFDDAFNDKIHCIEEFKRTWPAFVEKRNVNQKKYDSERPKRSSKRKATAAASTGLPDGLERLHSAPIEEEQSPTARMRVEQPSQVDDQLKMLESQHVQQKEQLLMLAKASSGWLERFNGLLTQLTFVVPNFGPMWNNFLFQHNCQGVYQQQITMAQPAIYPVQEPPPIARHSFWRPTAAGVVPTDSSKSREPLSLIKAAQNKAGIDKI